MSLQKQLHDLKKQKKEHAKALHRTYIRTKRDARRALSPDRIIRKHIGVSIGAAAIAGLMLAPAPPPHYTLAEPPAKDDKKKRRKRSSMFSRLLKLVKKFVPEAAAIIPDLENLAGRTTDAVDGAEPSEQTPPEKSPPKEEPPKPKSLIAHLLLELSMMALQKIPWQHLLAMVMQKIHPPQESAHHAEKPPEPPESSEEHAPDPAPET